tara:strand:- start:446 stop:748 length:303 start_codon:yes stop_codon:yes gene_type:complete
MEKGLFNITTSGSVTPLIPMYSGMGGVNSIYICNYSSTNTATVTIYLEDNDAVKANVLHETVIPIGVSLLLDHNLTFNDAVLKMDTVVTSSDPKVSIIIK